MVFNNRESPIDDDDLDTDISAYVPGWSTESDPFNFGEYDAKARAVCGVGCDPPLSTARLWRLMFGCLWLNRRR